MLEATSCLVRPVPGLPCRLVVPNRDQICSKTTWTLSPAFDDATFQMIYIDPPFNTGKSQSRTPLRRRWPQPSSYPRGAGGSRCRSLAI